MSAATIDTLGTALDAPVVEVTLLEDRARVVRRGRAELTAGSSHLLISGVAPVLADKTVFARVAPGAARVSDVRVVRRKIADDAVEGGAEEAAEERQKLVAELRERHREERSIASEGELLAARADGLHHLAGWTLAELAEDVSMGRPLAVDVSEKLAELAAEERELRRRGVANGRRLIEHQTHSERLEARIAALGSPATRTWAGLVLDVECERAGDVEIEIEYVVPGALWRPAHSAQIDGDQLTIATAACVWQNTGEDWSQVQLRLSTERASLGAEPPPLSTDELAARRRQERVVVETREQEVHALAARGEGVAVAAELPGIDDGGAAVALAAPGLADIPSDGRPYRVPLSEIEVPARVELWAYPELSAQVVTKSVQANGGDRPLLAGPVELVRERGWAGRTSVGFVAPGEEFELSWGPDPDLRVRRQSDESIEESRMLSSWSSRRHHIEIRISNLGRERRRLKVRERIPVSEIEKVKIELDRDRTSDGRVPDEDGFVTWDVELGPGERRELELRYTLKRHDDVVGL